MTVRAFKVSSSDEERSIIVFAATAGRARSLGHGEVGCNDGFLDVHVARERSADGCSMGSEGVLSWEAEANRRVYRSLGWWSADSRVCCVRCELYVYDDLPESHLDGSGICGDCADQLRALTDADARRTG